MFSKAKDLSISGIPSDSRCHLLVDHHNGNGNCIEHPLHRTRHKTLGDTSGGRVPRGEGCIKTGCDEKSTVASVVQVYGEGIRRLVTLVIGLL